MKRSGDRGFAPSEFTSFPPLVRRDKNRAKFHSSAENSAWQFLTELRRPRFCAALRGSLFEVNATLFSAPRIPDPPLFRQGILPPASAQRQRIRPRIPREFVSPESTLFLSPSLLRREVRGASFHPSFFLISFLF